MDVIITGYGMIYNQLIPSGRGSKKSSLQKNIYFFGRNNECGTTLNTIAGQESTLRKLTIRSYDPPNVQQKNACISRTFQDVSFLSPKNIAKMSENNWYYVATENAICLPPDITEKTTSQHHRLNFLRNSVVADIWRADHGTLCRSPF